MKSDADPTGSAGRIDSPGQILFQLDDPEFLKRTPFTGIEC